MQKYDNNTDIDKNYSKPSKIWTPVFQDTR